MPAPPPSARGPLRAAVERHSAAPLAWLALRPRSLPLLVVLVLMLGAALLPRPLGVLCLGALLALVGWLTYLSWPVLDPGARAVRLAVLAMVVALLAPRLG